MDNQQPSLEYRKVQRLSHRRVLSNVISYIIWETPPIRNGVYLYKLVDNNDQPRYIGITIDPKTRLSHHIKDKTKSHKTSWIKSCISNNIEIKMVVFKSYIDIEIALRDEEHYINHLNDLTNHELHPTTPNLKECYLYNLESKEIIKFNSVTSAMVYADTRGILTARVIKGKYLFSYNNNFEQIIDRIATIKILTPEGTIIKCVSQYHASKVLNCSKGMINSCLMKIRNNYKGYLISKINEEFGEYRYRHSLKIQCINDNRIFSSIKEASVYYNVDSSMIVKVCKDKRKHVKGLKFKYYE